MGDPVPIDSDALFNAQGDYDVGVTIPTGLRIWQGATGGVRTTELRVLHNIPMVG